MSGKKKGGYSLHSPRTCVNCKKEFLPKTMGDCYCSDCRDECVKHDNDVLERMTDNPEALLKLTSAILANAADDYKSDVRKWRKAYTSERKSELFYTLINWCRWFKSAYFQMLSMGELDGAKIQKMLNKQIYKRK